MKIKHILITFLKGIWIIIIAGYFIYSGYIEMFVPVSTSEISGDTPSYTNTYEQSQASEYNQAINNYSNSTSTEEEIVDDILYVGSVNSNKFHYPDCEWAEKIHSDNLIKFSSRDEALSYGYVPCKVCNP